VPPGLEKPEDEPETPVIPDGTKLSRGIKAELKGLPLELADAVAAHLWAAGELVDTDPELAFRHAEAARRRAARLPITREASAETAYAAEKYDEALTQYKALRRITGSDDYLPVIADSYRALGKHREALATIEEGKKADLDPSMAVELLIVQAGIRDDMGQRAEALRLLRNEIERPTLRHPRVAQARLLYAHADLLSQEGDMEGARKGFLAAASLDTDANTSALERLDEMDGATFEIDPEEFEEPEEESNDSQDSDRSDEDEWDDDELDEDSDDDESEEDSEESDEDADEDSEKSDDSGEDDSELDDEGDSDDEDSDEESEDADSDDEDDSEEEDSEEEDETAEAETDEADVSQDGAVSDETASAEGEADETVVVVEEAGEGFDE
jgi:hypothetical protein